MTLRKIKIKEAEELIDSFRSNFKELIGTDVIIKYMLKDDYTKENLPILNLIELEEIVNKFLLEVFPSGIKDTIKSRKGSYIMYKHIFCKLAYDMNHTTVEIGKYLNQTHSTVCCGKLRCKDLLFSRDKEYVETYTKIVTYIKIIYGYDDNVQHTDKEECNT